MHKKIDQYLSEIEYVGSYEDHEYGAEELTDRMIDFFMVLDPDNLYDEQLDMYMNIMGDFDEYADMDDEEEDWDEEEMSEAPAAVRVKRDREQRRKARADYRKKKASIKLKAKQWRKKPAYKKYLRKKKIFKSRGKTSTGKRIRKFI